MSSQIPAVAGTVAVRLLLMAAVVALPVLAPAPARALTGAAASSGAASSGAAASGAAASAVTSGAAVSGAVAGTSVPVYLVPGPAGQVSGETLPEVAAKTLGDSTRWLELFALNRGRVQPDGGALLSPSTRLRSGWVLVLPSDARSGGAQVAVPPSGPSAADRFPQQEAGTGSTARQTVPSGGGTVLGLRPAAAGGIGAGLLIGAFAAGGALLIRRRTAGPRRGVAGPRWRGVAGPRWRGGRRVPGDRAATAQATGQSRAVLERALNQLPAGSAAHVYAAIVGPDRLSLRLSPALPDAPPPWQVREQGWVWEALNWQLDGLAGGGGTAGAGARGGELPLLVPVGTIGGEWTAVNLGRAPGLVAFPGDARAAARAVAAVVEEIGLSPAAASVAITVVGPAPRIGLRPDRFRVTGDLPGALAEPPGQLANPDVTAVLPVGRGGAAAGFLRRQLVVVTTPIPVGDQEWLGALAAESDDSVAVLVLGDAPNAAWRFDVGAAGALDVGVLGLQLDRPEPAMNRSGSRR